MDITVTNHSGKDLVGRFNSQDYRFPLKKPVSVPEVVARHILGYGLPVAGKENAVIAMGWSKMSTDMPEALARLAKFHFEPPENPRSDNVPFGAGPRIPLQASKDEAGGKLLLAE